jgi:hypothetical protein
VGRRERVLQKELANNPQKNTIKNKKKPKKAKLKDKKLSETDENKASELEERTEAVRGSTEVVRGNTEAMSSREKNWCAFLGGHGKAHSSVFFFPLFFFFWSRD